MPMGDKDKAFRRLLADERLFLKFLRRFLKQNLPDIIDVEALTLDDLHREEGRFGDRRCLRPLPGTGGG